jgi:hypothetical protein
MNSIKNTFIFAGWTLAFYSLFFLLLFFYHDDTGKSFIYNTQDYYFNKGGNTYRALHDINSGQKYDVLVLGGSHVYRGYDPRIFAKQGLQLYNLGTSNQTISNTYFISKEYLHTNTAKLVLLDFYDEGFLENGLEFESALNLIPNFRESNKVPLEMAFALYDFRLLNVYWLRLLNYSKQPININEKQYVYNGYCERTDSIKEAITMDKIPDKVERIKCHFLEKFLQRMLALKLPVVAVNYPNPWLDYQPRHQQFYNTIAPIFKHYKIPVLDYAYRLKIDSKNHYYDYTHLNQAGVTLFNEQLLKDLRQLQVIK